MIEQLKVQLKEAKKIESLINVDEIDANIEKSNKAIQKLLSKLKLTDDNDISLIIFEEIKNESSPCYLCARKRRGNLYATAKELGCNKIALGHHFDDVIETILLNVLYSGNYKTMMPKLKSKNFSGMELIRPLYYVKEDDIISWKRYNNLTFLDCACNITKKNLGKRLEVKNLIRELRKTYDNIDINILNSSRNVNIDAILGYKKNGKEYSFLDNYEKIFDED